MVMTGNTAIAPAAWPVTDAISLQPKRKPTPGLFPFCCHPVHPKWNKPPINFLRLLYSFDLKFYAGYTGRYLRKLICETIFPDQLQISQNGMRPLGDLQKNNSLKLLFTEMISLYEVPLLTATEFSYPTLQNKSEYSSWILSA